MALLNPGAQRQLVAAFRAAAHASTDDHFIEQARGAEQALAEDRLDVERVRQNFSRLVEAMCAEADLVDNQPIDGTVVAVVVRASSYPSGWRWME